MRRNQRSIAIYAMVIGFCLGVLGTRLFGADLQRPPMRRDDPPVLQRPPMRRDPVLIAANTQMPPPVTSGPCRECVTAPLMLPSGATQVPQLIGPATSESCSNCGWGPSSNPPLLPRSSIAQPLPGPVLVSNPDSVIVTVSPMSRATSERILGKRIGKIAAVWLVTMENHGAEPVTISPSAIYRRVAHLQPFDHIVISQLIDEGARNSFLARSGRAAGDVGKLSAFLIASKTIQIAETWPLALVTGAGWAIPYLIDRLKGAEVPIYANFERLAWVAPIPIGPNETATTHIFTELWDSPSPITFLLDTGRVTLRKSVQ